MKYALICWFSLLAVRLVAAQPALTNYAVTATAGSNTDQELEISNPGPQPAAWTLSTSPDSWIRLERKQATLAPGTNEKFLFHVAIPANAPVGEKEDWLYVESEGKRTPIRVSVFVGTIADREAAWEIESAEGAGRLVAKKVLRGEHLYLQLSLRNQGTLYLTPRFNWTLETTKGEVLQKEPVLREGQSAAPGSATVLELRLVPIKKKAIYRLRCHVEEVHDLLPPMDQSIELQLP